jgi:serine protease DegQ
MPANAMPGDGDSPRGPSGSPFEEFLRDFVDPPAARATDRGEARGSGVIVDVTGHVVTTAQAVAGAAAVSVVLHDGKRVPARVVGADAVSDVALLKIETDGPFAAAQWGDSDRLRVGDWLIAIGNPLGLDNTVTVGIISALGRSSVEVGVPDKRVKFIQTDAAINPGNSGGALINTEGNLIGINSAIYSRNGGSMGIGFAIPANIAKQVMEQIVATGTVTRGWVGIEAQDITPELAESFKLPKARGSLIAGVLKNSPADIAGIKAGDVLLAINDKEIADSSSMLNIIAALKPNEEAVLQIARAEKEIKINVIIGTRPKPVVAKK